MGGRKRRNTISGRSVTTGRPGMIPIRRLPRTRRTSMGSLDLGAKEAAKIANNNNARVISMVLTGDYLKPEPPPCSYLKPDVPTSIKFRVSTGRELANIILLFE